MERKQKPSNIGEQVPAIDTHREIKYVRADVALEEVNSNAVDITLDGNCGFIDLEEVAAQPAEDTVQLEAGSHCNQTVQYEVRDQHLAETAAAATDISSSVDDACDKEESDAEMDICLLDTPEFIIDQRSCCTTPSSLISWHLDVGDTLLSLDCDSCQDDENVLSDDAELLTQTKWKDQADECHNVGVEEFPDRDIQSVSLGNEVKLRQSEEKQGRKEVHKENICMHSVSRCDVDVEKPVDNDVSLQLDDEKMDSVDSSAELATASSKSVTSGPPRLHTAWSLDVSSVAVGWTEEPAAKVNLFPSAKSSDHDAECSQLATLDKDTEGNQCDDDLVIPSQFALSGKREKSLLRRQTTNEQFKTAADKSKVCSLKRARTADEPLVEDPACSDLAVKQSRTECQNSMRKSSRQSRQRQVKANVAATVPEVETCSEPQLPQADAETLRDADDKESHPEAARRSLKTRGQQKKQMGNTEESADQKSKGDSPKQDSCINIVSSQHEFVTNRSATKKNVTDKKLLESKPRGRELRKQQKKSTKKSLNQKGKVDGPKLDVCLILSSSHAGEAHKSILEASLEADNQLELKPTERSLRTRGQLKKRTEKSVDTKRQRKPDRSSPKQDVCTNILSPQETNETHELWTANDRTNLKTAVVNIEPLNYIENENPEEMFEEHNDRYVAGQLFGENRLTGSRSCNINTDYPVSSVHHVLYENDAASPTIQPIHNAVGDGVKGVGCCYENSLALSGQSDELVSSCPAESCILQNEILCSQLVDATQASAVDNSQCGAVVVNDQEQNTDAAVKSTTSYTADSVQDTGKVKHATVNVPEDINNPDDLNVHTAVNRPGKQKSSVPQCVYLSCGVMNFGRTVISHPRNVGHCGKTMETDATIAKQRVMESAAIELNIEDVTHHEVSSQNSLMIASQEFAHILPPVDNLHHSQSYSSTGLLPTVSSGATRGQGISRKVSTLNEHTYEGEDPMADDSEFHPQLTRRQKCSIAATESAGCFLSCGFFRSASGKQRQQQVMRNISEAVCDISPEANEIPNTLPQMHSQVQSSTCNELQKHAACASREGGRMRDHSEFSPAQTTALQQRRQKCSVSATEYSDALLAAQLLCNTQQTVASPGNVSCTIQDVDEIPSSLPQIQSQMQSRMELQKQAAYSSCNDSVIDFSEFAQTSASQQHRRHEFFECFEYSHGSQIVQRLHDTQQESVTTSADHSAPAVNRILSSLHSQVQSSTCNELQKHAACAGREEDRMHDRSELSPAQTAALQQHRQKCSINASEYSDALLAAQALGNTQQTVASSGDVSSTTQGMNEIPTSLSQIQSRNISEAVCDISPEANKIPNTLPQMHSQVQSSTCNELQKHAACAGSEGDRMRDHSEFSPAHTTALQQHRQKCSVNATEYSDALLAAQSLCNTQQTVALSGNVSSTTQGMDEIPSSVPQIQSQMQSRMELQKQAAYSSCNDSVMDFSEFAQTSTSQEHRRHKFSECFEYSHGSQIVQRLHDSLQENVTASADLCAPEMNGIPSSLPLTHRQRYSICMCSSVAPEENQPVVSYCRQAVDTVRPEASATGQSRLPNDDDAGESSSSFAFPCPAFYDTDAYQSGRVADGSDGGGGIVNVSQAGAEHRIKVSEPLFADCRNEMEDDKRVE